MSLKAWVTIGILVGSTIGGYIPTLWDQSFLSVISMFGSLVGGLVGIWLGYKIGKMLS